jgi:hypothetical protein
MNKSNKVSKRNTVLGISPGTKYLGISVFRQGELIEYKVKTYYGKISKKKLQRIMNTIHETIDGYGVESIAVKVPEGIIRSKEVRQIISDIEKISTAKQLRIFRCNISGLKQACLEEKITSRQGLVEYLMQKYPELSFVEQNGGLNRHVYYGKMFEAVAAGMQIGN